MQRHKGEFLIKAVYWKMGPNQEIRLTNRLNSRRQANSETETLTGSFTRKLMKEITLDHSLETEKTIWPKRKRTRSLDTERRGDNWTQLKHIREGRQSYTHGGRKFSRSWGLIHNQNSKIKQETD